MEATDRRSAVPTSSPGSSLAEEFRTRLVARIRELEASVAELEDLRGIAASLGIELDGEAPATAAAPAASSARAPVSPRYARATRSRGGRAGSRAARSSSSGGAGRHPTRRERVLEIVGEQPDITVSELVDAMRVNRTSLYPVVRQLISDGLLQKSGKYLRLAG